ncbi:MAG TPA: hypothetical protein VK186_19765, partial [Candidatus Deferrimicrobium sp.]|nr:hypothetical protein [Candidatus Deferrimicrobium sp.]
MAEELIEEAREKGLNTSIFRVGNLVFQSGTGRFQENIEDNAFYSILQSFLKIGIMIDSDQPMLDFSFIDQTGKTVALLFDRQALRGETHHLLNPNKVSLNQLAVMLSELGECLRTAPADEFLDLLQKNYEHPHLKKYIEKIILHTHLLSNHDGSFIDMAYEK